MLRRSVFKLPLAVGLVATATATATAPAQAAAALGDVHIVTAPPSPATWVQHAIRHGDGSWDRFNSLPTGELPMTENLSSVVAGGEEHLVYQVPALPKPIAWLTVLRTRHLDGSWSRQQIPLGSNWGVTSVAVVNGELHVVQRDGREGKIRHLVRHLDGSWSAVTEIPAVGSGASLANVNGVLHLVVTDGESNTTLRLLTWQAGTWSQPVDATALPHLKGRSARAAIAGVGTDLHAVVRTADGGLQHAIRTANGVWSGWGSITGEAGSPGTPDALAVTASRNTLHVAITTTSGGLFHTIRYTDGNWQQFGNVEGAAGQVDTREVTIAGE